MLFPALTIFCVCTVGFAINCYTCVNQRIDECMKSNQTCGKGFDKCFSMQKEAIDGGYRYTKLCADEWYCERTDAACDDLDEPEYSYMECNVGCCTDDLCNGAESGLFGRSLLLMMLGVLLPIAMCQLQ